MSKMYLLVRRSSDNEGNIVNGVTLRIDTFEELIPAVEQLEQDDNSVFDFGGLQSDDIDDNKIEEFANELYDFVHEFFTK